MLMKPVHDLSRQRGITLIESLVALVVLALGIMGLIGIQSRSIVETRQSNQRATAIRLIADLNERIALNRSVGSLYVDSSSDADYKANCPVPTGDTMTTCTALQRAQKDVSYWKLDAVPQAYPRGNISELALMPGNRQLRVIIGWLPNEKDATSTSIPDGLKITSSGNGPPIPNECSTTHICHMQYLELPFNSPPLP